MNITPAALATPLQRRYQSVRDQSLALAAPLSEADCQAQSMPDASPTKWHLAHTTWFFETFVLERFEAGFQPFDPAFRVLFNSYYQGVGDQYPRPQRGLVTRPGMAGVRAYRAQVDRRIAALLARGDTPELTALVELGLQHEQQHQELLLTDIKHLLACNPTDPVYREHWPLVPVAPAPLRWVAFEGGPALIGHADDDGFAFDNETPRHSVLLTPHALANRPVTHGEWLAFMHDGGYSNPRWWMAAGWDWVRAQRVEAPLYWRKDENAGGGPAQHGDWTCLTLHGRVPIDPHTPVVHIGWFEADAYARWCAAQQGEPIRLPTEAEWEHAAQTLGAGLQAHGNFMDSGALHPLPLATDQPGLQQMGGDVWEWTASAYLPYPGYRPWTGAVGEYNGKFMINQMVLRGGSCATPRDHIRASYRNFFPTDARWQFSGVRLAKDL
ncbi:ergothioneine biosynthesis protein EgtB [Hydrogenophaga pseudoflava]|uniref:ergothioneine biosynthesis protein EgtB n=1 Tax=Hydrogenophaga pseudoflava TaxID=47421 RepID=UPI0027E43115|nr:ergothioneine biosynthesis protein EgtB [Hydrogenophaga pseudoflava]MDQ7746714.1 ergothioneine biosynthesis protein EgtB [Hydrogenophaga pseudoflava]